MLNGRIQALRPIHRQTCIEGIACACGIDHIHFKRWPMALALGAVMARTIRALSHHQLHVRRQYLRNVGIVGGFTQSKSLF